MKVLTDTQRCPPELLSQPVNFTLPNFFCGRKNDRDNRQSKPQDLSSGVASHTDDVDGLPDSLDWVRDGLHWAPPLLGSR